MTDRSRDPSKVIDDPTNLINDPTKAQQRSYKYAGTLFSDHLVLLKRSGPLNEAEGGPTRPTRVSVLTLDVSLEVEDVEQSWPCAAGHFSPTLWTLSGHSLDTPVEPGGQCGPEDQVN